jgi:HK97 family phage major capsid protein
MPANTQDTADLQRITNSLNGFIEDATGTLDGVNERVRTLENEFARSTTIGSRSDDRSDSLVDATGGLLARTVGPNASIRSFAEEITYGADGVSVGGIVRAMATGKATPEIRAALTEGTDSAGGYSVPEKYSTEVIDNSRARSVVVRAGARTVPINGEKQHYLRILSDPVVAWREELGAVNQSDPTFGRMTFIPRSLAVIVRASRELLEDSMNVEQAIEASIAGAFASEIDRVALFGTGTPPEPLGVANTPGINQVDAGAGIDGYGPLLEARRKILAANGNEPTAVILSAATDEVFGGLVDTTGQPLRMPRAIEELPIYATSHTDTDLADGAIVGDFRQLWLGIRRDLRIEPLRELFAATMEVGFLCYMRLDVAVVRPASFSLITLTPTP